MTQTAHSIKPGIAAPTLLAIVVSVAAVGWTFWPTFQALSVKWFNDAGYSHGVLVPFFCAYLLWIRRGDFVRAAPLVVPGFLLILAAVALRTVGALFSFQWFDAVALIPCLSGIALVLGGRSALKAALPAIGFSFFMIPLPFKLETMLGGPLQTLASRGSAFLLQTLGQPAVREGNTIMINDTQLEIVNACSGLRMLVTFFTFSTGVAILIRKPILEKLCIVLSAIPIALLTNILRITLTGVMFQINAKFAHMFFHDLAGWFMMPVCLAFLGLELWILNRLIIEPRQAQPARLALR